MNGLQILILLSLGFWIGGSSQVAGCSRQYVEHALIRNLSTPIGTETVLRFSGGRTKGILLQGNDFRSARNPFLYDTGLIGAQIRREGNVMAK